MPTRAIEWKEIATALESRGFRCTLPRRAIIQAMVAAEGYFDAEALLRLAQGINARVSRATVYRTILILCELGWLHQTDFGNGHHHYRRHDERRQPSVEVLVVECGGVFEQAAPFLTWYGQTVANRIGVELIGGRLQLFAHCVRHQRGTLCAECPRRTTATPAIRPQSPSPSAYLKHQPTRPALH